MCEATLFPSLTELPPSSQREVNSDDQTALVREMARCCSLSSEDTVFSSAGTDSASSRGPSTRSSRTSSGYSGVSSMISDTNHGVSLLAISTVSEETAVGDADENGVFCGDDSNNDEDTSSANHHDDDMKEESKLEPSLKMIRKLKRLSDVWSNVSRCTDDAIIVTRLKKGREQAIKKQTYIEELLNEASSQYNIQQQAKTLLQLCSEDSNSVDEIESERIILLAGERYKVYHEEAEHIVNDLGSSMCELEPRSSENEYPATLYISDIRLNLTDKFTSTVRGSSNHTHHFLCLLKEDKTKGIIATQIVSTHSRSISTVLHYTNRLLLPEIPSNLLLIIEIYHLSCKERRRKKGLSRVMSSVKKAPGLRRSRYFSCTSDFTQDSRQQEAAPVCSGPGLRTQHVIESSFKRVGNTTLSRKELLKTYPHQILGSEVATSIQLVVHADPIYSDQSTEGYLNVRIIEWERRWFVLNSVCLRCWLCTDQADRNEEPMNEWNISDCFKFAYSASSETCAWKYAFILPLESIKHKEKALTFTAHSAKQKNEWINALNSVIYSNLSWNKPC